MFPWIYQKCPTFKKKNPIEGVWKGEGNWEVVGQTVYRVGAGQLDLLPTAKTMNLEASFWVEERH